MKPTWEQIQFLLAACREEFGMLLEAVPEERETTADLEQLLEAGYLSARRLNSDDNDESFDHSDWDSHLLFCITDAGRVIAESHRDMAPPELTREQIKLLREAQTHSKRQIIALWKHGGDNARYRQASHLTRRGLLRLDAEKPSRFRLTGTGNDLLRAMDGIAPEPQILTVCFTFWWWDGANGSVWLEAVADAEGIEKADEYAERWFWFFYHLRIRSRRASDPVIEVGCVSANAMDAADFERLTRKLLRHYKPELIPPGFSPIPETIVTPIVQEDYTGLRPWLYLTTRPETREKKRFVQIEIRLQSWRESGNVSSKESSSDV